MKSVSDSMLTYRTEATSRWEPELNITKAFLPKQGKKAQVSTVIPIATEITLLIPLPSQPHRIVLKDCI